MAFSPKGVIWVLYMLYMLWPWVPIFLYLNMISLLLVYMCVYQSHCRAEGEVMTM